MSEQDNKRTVALASERAGWGRSLVASFPRTLARQDDLQADIVLVDGTGNWVALATHALSRGARQLLVLETGITDREAPLALANAADVAGANVKLASALSDSAATQELQGLLDESFGELVVNTTGVDALPELMLGQLRLMHGLGISGLQLKAIARTASAFVIEGHGQLENVPRLVRLTCAQTTGPIRTCVTGHAALATAKLSWRGGADARPVEVSLADSSCLRVLPAIHEGGHRHALRAFLLSQGATTGSADLRAFNADLELAHGLLGAA